MLKKIILTLLLIGFIGILVWGGVNRTLAKTTQNDGNSAETTGNGTQGLGADHTHDGLDEDCDHDGTPINQADSSGRGNGNGGRGQRNNAIELAATLTPTP
ncbi:hypothetical protein KQH61_00215 [bacterium]|nr:hypothetical protein [bacterium]